ncbi:MAG: efflux RND transporter periplasmic adaptor subunit [candidate division WOR-3 bacterium]|nr:MAG: efflux RND transporter periplasmic adaptor subunit [candidate division WOR-3 bacterium]
MFSKKTMIGGAVFFTISLLLFMSCGGRAEKAVVDTGMIGKQAICPVTGDTFTVHASTPVVVYKGEEYYMCCPGCDLEFMKDPEKYLDEMKRSGGGSQAVEPAADEVSYWTCSMHPEVRSETEGNCPICGMALIPVYERSESSNTLHLESSAVALAGIRTQPVKKERLHREIRLAGRVAFDPELVTAQEEYINAIQMRDGIENTDRVTLERAEQLIAQADYRLRLLGMDGAEIRILARARRAQSSLVMPQNESWVYADAYESDIGWIERGQSVTVTSAAQPDKKFTGKVVAVSPTLTQGSRSNLVRIKLSKPEAKLKPGMYVETTIISPIHVRGTRGSEYHVLAIPAEALLDTGSRKVVWVYVEGGGYQPRTVKIGPAGYVHGGSTEGRYYPVLDGLKEGELVVTNGNFLLDSESRITGVAATGYGGALGVDDQTLPGHQH